MKLSLKFKQSDFESLRVFEKAVRNQLGKVYVGTNSLCFYVEYPKELCALLRPKEGNSYLDVDKLSELLQKEQLEFELDSFCPDEKTK